MGRWMDYGRRAVAAAVPYVEETAERVGRRYEKSKRKVKREIRLRKLGRILDVLEIVLQVATTLMTLYIVWERLFRRYED